MAGSPAGAASAASRPSRPGAEGLVVRAVVGHGAELAGAAVVAADELAVCHYAEARAGAQRDAHEHVVVATRKCLCAKGIAVGVVVYGDGRAEALFKVVFEMDFLPGGDVHRVVDDAAVGVYQCGDADADGLYFRRDDAGDCIAQIVERFLQ